MRIALVLMPNWRRETPSLAIAYLASSLMKAGHEVSRFEFNLKVTNKDWYEKLQSLNDYKTDLNSDHQQYIDYCVNKISAQAEIAAFSIYDCNYRLSLMVA